MKIVDVRAHVLRSPLAQPFAFSQGWVGEPRRDHRRGDDRRRASPAGAKRSARACSRRRSPPRRCIAALKPLAIGADPLQPEVLWHRMYHQTRDYGMKGAVIGAISGVDIALWDIAGKVRGEPVAKLLGGMFRDTGAGVRDRVLPHQPARARRERLAAGGSARTARRASAR